FFGQGLSGHTGITTASRSPQNVRGRVISVSGLGFSLSEIVLPMATVWLLTTWHWREVWQLYAAIELVVIVAFSQILLWQFPINSQPLGTGQSPATGTNWSRGQMIRDRRFWLISPALFAPSIISTGLFFHQQSLAHTKGFPITVWASAISAYSIAAVTVSLIAGQAVDRWTGATVIKLLLMPFILAVLAAVTISSDWLPFIYYGLMGMTFGIATPAVSALWVELYGAANIASIRSLAHAIMVFSSALGPVIFGTLLDNNISWNLILVACAIWMTGATILLYITPLHKTAPQ
ncbi:MAG: MFS transporter, partial [Pseudomonadota bacterium]